MWSVDENFFDSWVWRPVCVEFFLVEEKDKIVWCPFDKFIHKFVCVASDSCEFRAEYSAIDSYFHGLEVSTRK